MNQLHSDNNSVCQDLEIAVETVAILSKLTARVSVFISLCLNHQKGCPKWFNFDPDHTFYLVDHTSWFSRLHNLSMGCLNLIRVVGHNIFYIDLYGKRLGPPLKKVRRAVGRT